MYCVSQIAHTFDLLRLENLGKTYYSTSESRTHHLRNSLYLRLNDLYI